MMADDQSDKKKSSPASKFYEQLLSANAAPAISGLEPEHALIVLDSLANWAIHSKTIPNNSNDQGKGIEAFAADKGTKIIFEKMEDGAFPYRKPGLIDGCRVIAYPDIYENSEKSSVVEEGLITYERLNTAMQMEFIRQLYHSFEAPDLLKIVKKYDPHRREPGVLTALEEALKSKNDSQAR